MSVPGYRRLLRSISYAFKGDSVAIRTAKLQLRDEFSKHRAATNIGQLLQDIEDIDTMLRFHIVQGKKSDKGNFAVSLNPEHQQTIAAGQHLKHGPELEAIDPSYVGRKGSVVVEKARADGRPFEEVPL
ncbi:hypothetical protein B484DRAFT_399925 [Ochromonadaceae sp. CCMP2298]|nr:hypothetical protein B484DRAFT_399925 [Ochromonadaceae sp. CCMP2298]|mmetsp:Transcript_32610/g.71759  ORF Transcript_32610/g.71759 Transcript_32610/m.71759 type:complete len:129 (-) Transcript_32610:1339-1725(-)